MTAWIALIRGINVGGNNILPMKDLRTLLERLGLRNTRTYIQSGNCLFECAGKNAPVLSSMIADAIGEAFGFRPQVMVLTKAEMDAAIWANPYPEGRDDPKSVHLFFLSEPASNADLDALGKIRKPSERFSLTDRVFYLHAPEGIGKSKLAAQAEKRLGVPVTARNLRTALKIAELAD